MKSGYRPLGELIELVDVRNTDGSVQNLIGVSINKCFIKSVANTIGTDLSTYKVIERDDFAVSLMQVSRDEKIPVACQKEYDKAIMSPAYPIFRVKNREEVLPDYLDLWFKRSEFDREAAFIAVGGVRGSMPWEDFCRMQVRVPDLEEQKKIVHAYKVIEDRINLKKRINENLELVAQTYLQKEIAANGVDTTVDALIELFDRMRKPLSSIVRSNMVRLYPYYGAAGLVDYVDNYIYDGIYGLIGEDGTVIDDYGHPIMQYVWGKFWVNNHAHIFKGKGVYSTEMAYLILKNIIIKDAVTGGVQLKINQENLKNLPVRVPYTDVIYNLNTNFDRIFKNIRDNCDEINQLNELMGVILSKLSEQCQYP